MMMLLLAQAQADNTTGAQSGNMSSLLLQMWWLPVLILVFWFLVFRPERQKQKKRQEMLNAIEKNDKVVTIGGIHGIVKSISDAEVTLLVDEKTGVTMKFLRSAIHGKASDDEKPGELEQSQR